MSASRASDEGRGDRGMTERIDEARPREPGAPPRHAGRRLSELVAVYGLAVVFVLVMAVFGVLRPNTFFSSININTILVGQSVTAILALAEMMPLATGQD